MLGRRPLSYGEAGMFKKKFHNSIDKGRYGYLFIAPFFIVFAVLGCIPSSIPLSLAFKNGMG